MAGYIQTAAELRSRLRRHKQVVVDFDETLCLINSTHAYINSATPSIVALTIMRAVSLVFNRVIRNPRLTYIYRDWVCVVLISIVLPWTYPVWRFRHARRHARGWMNRDLLRLLELESADLVAIISNGFSPIIRPLLKEAGINAPLIASSFTNGWRTRAIGKIRAWNESLPHVDHEHAVFITDSIDDADLLDVCGHGTLIEWGHPPIRPFARTYVPFFYTEMVKREGKRYLSRGVVRQDLFAVLLAFAFTAQFSLSLVFAIVLFQLAFWLVYEFGYFDNDRRAFFEEKGAIPPAFDLHRSRMRLVPALAFIVVLTLLASVLLALTLGPAAPGGAGGLLAASLATAGLWLLFLGASHLLFRLYNRTREKPRVFLYPALQLTRFGGLALFLPLTLVGAAVIAGFVIGRTAPYVVYRATGIRWGEYNRLLVFLFFAIVMALLALTRTLPFGDPLVLLQLAVAFVWLLARSRVEIATLFRRAAP